MSGLDLTVQGDVDSVRGTATGLSSMGDSIDDAATGFGQGAAASESLWQGPAADAFRSRIGTAQQATTQVVAATRRMSQALHVFADRMTKVKAEIAHAKSIAEGAGLTVAGATIQPPKPPPAPPAACYAPQAAAQLVHQQAAAAAKYRKQVRAYQQAERILTQARQDEQTAHTDVGTAADDEQGILADLNDHKYWVLGGLATGTVALGMDQSVKWRTKMGEFGLEYDQLRRDATAATDPVEHTELDAAADDAFDQADKAAGKTVTNARTGLGIDPESGLGKVVDHLPAGLAGVQAAWDIAHAHGIQGKVIAAASDGLAYGAGAGVTTAGDALFASLAIGGAPETMGLSLAAALAAYGVGYGVQHYGPAVANWTTHTAAPAVAHWTSHAADNVAGSVAGAVTHPGHTLSSLAGDVGSVVPHISAPHISFP